MAATNPKPPSLRLHKTGQFVVTWDGKDHYLGTNRAVAEQRYAEKLVAWKAWAGERLAAKEQARQSRKPPSSVAPAFNPDAPSLRGAIERIAASMAAEMTPEGAKFYKKNLKRLFLFAGDVPLETIDAAWLQAIKERLKTQYGGKTTNHTIDAARKLVKYAWKTMRWIPPVDLEGVKKIALPPPPIKGMEVDQVCEQIDKNRDDHEQLSNAMELAFLTGCRPSEVYRLIKGEGQLVRANCFVPSRHKNSNRTGAHRYIALCDRAVELLGLLRDSRWSSAKRLGEIVSKATGKQLHPLRHSAAMALADLDYTRAEVDEFLGHAVGRTSLTYNPQAIRKHVVMQNRLREALHAARLKRVARIVVEQDEANRERERLTALSIEQRKTMWTDLVAKLKVIAPYPPKPAAA